MTTQQTLAEILATIDHIEAILDAADRRVADQAG